MEEKKYKELIEQYASDCDTWVYCLDIAPLKQVIEVNKDTGRITHYEDKQYYFGFKNLFMEYYADPVIDNIDLYDYLLVSFPKLASDLAEEIHYWEMKGINVGYDQKKIDYIRYVKDWYKDHNEGAPACFYEWEMNEGSEHE